MKLELNAIASIILLLVATTSLAAPRLTPQQCNDYPFKQPVGEITRAQATQELAELEAVGYHPGENDLYYPRNLQAAERKLQAEYQRDCGPSSPAISTAN
jgi:hypothetical protein